MPTANAHRDAGVIVRRARPGDLSAVHALVRELADFERAPEAVVTTPSDYVRDMASGWFECLVAAEPEAHDATLLGAMVYHRAFSTWKGPMLYLEDFVVAAAARRRGIGSALWSALVAEARAQGCSSIKWQVLDWNDSAKAFYRARGAELEGGWDNGRLWL